jgi:VanZ family protein
MVRCRTVLDRLARDVVPLVVWMGAIYVLSDQPDLPHAPDPWLDFMIKKAMHALGYTVLAWLWWRALRGLGVRRALLAAFVLTVAYAASDEWHQTFVPGRTGRAADVVVDGVGALVGIVVVAVRSRRPPLAPP